MLSHIVKFASSGVSFMHASAEINGDTIDINIPPILNFKLKKKNQLLYALLKFELPNCYSNTDAVYLGGA